MESKIVPTYTVRVYLAGDLATAKMYLRRECWFAGLCVTIEATTFLYTAGEEDGVVVGFVNYPRFPSEPAELYERAKLVAAGLMDACCQRTALLVATDKTEWLSRQAPGQRG